MQINENIIEILNALSLHKLTASQTETVSEFAGNLQLPMNAELFSMEYYNLIYPLNGAIREIAATYIKDYDEYAPKTQFKLTKLYMNYTNAENRIADLVESLSGTFVCSCDAARYVLRAYEKQLCGEEIVFPEERGWNMPAKGSEKHWLAVADAYVNNTIGSTEFVDALINLRADYLGLGEVKTHYDNTPHRMTDNGDFL